MSIPIIYVAGAFRGPKLADVDRNIAIASMFIAPIAEAGAMPVCVHLCEGLRAHDVQQANSGAWWLDATMSVLRRCDALVLVPGWQKSVGSYWEVREALDLGMPVFEASWLDNVSEFEMPVPDNVNAWGPVDLITGEPGNAAAEWAGIEKPMFGEWMIGQLEMQEAV